MLLKFDADGIDVADNVDVVDDVDFFVCFVEHTVDVVVYFIDVVVQGGFFNWSSLKMTKCQTLRNF